MLGNLIRRLLRRDSSPSSDASRAPGAAAPLAQALELHRQARHDETVAICRALLAREPLNTDTLNLLAAAMCGRGEAREGSTHLRRITELMPHSADAHVNLATVLAAIGDIESAIIHYRHAVRLRPSLPGVWRDLAALLQALRRYDEAESCCRSALQARARSTALLRTLANALFEQGRVDEAIVEVRASLALDPDAAAAHSDLVRMLNYAESGDPVAVWQEHHTWGLRHARALGQAAAPHANDPDPARRLRVGYVSPYFCKHAMNFFFESTVKHHDRENFDVVLYADVARPDEYSKRLQDYGATWRRTVGMSDAELADAVRRDAIDILVDLSGHTPHNRLLAFARRPAPVQVTWNGYPNTTGMAAMDYRITDAWCDPRGATEHLHSERLARLPAIFMTWQPPDDAPEPGSPPALQAGHVTFGSFNSCFKITPAVAALWSRVLDRVPGSRLMLLTVDGGVAEWRIRDLFARNGIAPERLEILPRLPHEGFLEAHRRADIALDTYPYHGTTTTCFSLWMGLPVVVRAGSVHASRVGVSLLNNIGLPELVAASDDEYVDIAVRLASNVPELAGLRTRLRECMLNSPLTDGREGARALERAYRAMWADWCGPRGAARPRNVIASTAYGPVVVNRHDNMIGRYMMEDGAWEQDEIELLRWTVSACCPGETGIEILDIGANVGGHTIAFARFAHPNVTVHAFEAQRTIFAMLEQTVALNGLDNVRCYQRAVSAVSGATIEIPAVDYDQAANFGALELEHASNPDFDGTRIAGSTETITTMRIDELDLQKVQLIKIDVEGMEDKVLEGAARTIERCRPVIFLEYHKTDFERVKAFLHGARYVAYYASRPNILCLPEEVRNLTLEGAERVAW